MTYIKSSGPMNTANVEKFVNYIASNDLLLREAVRLARHNLSAFMDLAFDLPKENRAALREALTPGFSAALIDIVLDAIDSGAELEFEVVPPTERSARPLVLTIETASTPAGVGGPKKFKCRCKPEDGKGPAPIEP